MAKHLPKINISAIPHKSQRYETVGDYFFNGNEQEFLISRMSNPDYEFLVLMHELTEWYLTQKRGIKEKDITAFDLLFEAMRVKGNVDEPGFAKNCPYKNEHAFATKIEKLLAKELGVDWKTYDDTVVNL